MRLTRAHASHTSPYLTSRAALSSSPEHFPDSPLKRYQRRVADGELRADHAQLAAIRQLDALHRALVSGKQKPGLVARLLARLSRRQWSGQRGIYLWGGVGTGKTLLMDSFYRALPETSPEPFGKRIHYHRFMQWLHDEKNRIHERQNPLAIIAAQLAARHRVLCVDEFSVTDITDAMLLSGLLQHLFDNNVTLLTTSNTHPDDLYRDGLQRQRFLPAIELLKRQMQIVKVDGGNDYRMAYLQSGTLYLVPHDQAARRKLRTSFIHLEGNLGDRRDTIILCGREIDIIATGRGTVWFGFAALCNSNRSKLDYIELSKRFHTVMIEDIPMLDAEHDDAARRLIELIDELYDRGVNLIVSAACAPQQLYTGTRLRQPFERTASRLREMSSRAYLARPHLL